ncbi:hypothetical protein HX875_01085 [Pseudomonas yamanorum]|uniref:hypothetical protein n=1 Tax=Pseudomonas yamanorum TaxID=515393 RepID=UPI0015A1FB2B|nr:hypothetical protein [Pseudomonas yamanorum]NWE38047.1 hypothetical protein [Pseudomonas yamanorum]
MNWKAIDWKYIVMFLVTLVCALIPVLWQSSQEARSISVKLSSSTTLQLGPKAGIKDLQVTLDGHNIDRPYLSLFEVVNDGSKPILSSEFESPIELFTKNEASVVTAQIAETIPAGITAKISVDDKRAKIAPYLVNPDDSVFFTILTSGGAPKFEAHARIAGIKEVKYVDSSVPAPNRVSIAVTLIVALCMITLYFLYMAFASRRLIVSSSLARMTGITLITGVVFILRGMKAQIEAFLPFSLGLPVLLPALFILGGLCAWWISKRTERATPH